MAGMLPGVDLARRRRIHSHQFDYDRYSRSYPFLPERIKPLSPATTTTTTVTTMDAAALKARTRLEEKLRSSEHAEKFGFGVVERFVGHGVGTVFHSEPIILHNRNNRRGCMVEGQTFTIEPILTLGSIECKTWDDNWTTLTVDGSPAAQFEHTILITRTGAEILTKC